MGSGSTSVLYLCGAGNPEGVRLAIRINRRQARWDRIALLDDDERKHGQSILGVPIAGPFSMLERTDSGALQVANLVARTTIRRWLARRKIEVSRLPPATLVDPDVELDDVTLGQDVVVYRNAFVGPLVSVADASVIFMGAVIGHGSRLGRCCVVGPNAVVNARVHLDDGVYVGTNATILPDVSVGAWATVGAGSVVLRNVPAGVTVMGVPAKTLITREIRLKMCGSTSLPAEIRRELESEIS